MLMIYLPTGRRELSVISQNKIVGIELQNKVVFKSSEKLLVALRGIYYFTGIKMTLYLEYCPVL